MKSATYFIFIALSAVILASCKSKTAGPATPAARPKVSVKTTTVQTGNIEDQVQLNGKTVFLKKNAVAAPTTGFLKKVLVQYGDVVHRNDLLFEIQTKENKALENSGLDSELAPLQNGNIRVFSPSDGVVGEMNINSPGMFVTEGGALCTIVEYRQMMVQVNVPFGDRSWIKPGKTCRVLLSDSSSIDGSIVKIMPVINQTSQTQDVFVRVRGNRAVPENLNVLVTFVRENHQKALLIPRAALLTNETQEQFWVMKILNDSIAVKVPISKGIENGNIIEILSPKITVNDMIISEGAYGLPDSAIVKVVK